jgi:hypothetical protein
MPHQTNTVYGIDGWKRGGKFRCAPCTNVTQYSDSTAAPIRNRARLSSHAL